MAKSPQEANRRDQESEFAQVLDLRETADPKAVKGS